MYLITLKTLTTFQPAHSPKLTDVWMKIQLQTTGESPFLVRLSPKLHRSILFKIYVWARNLRKNNNQKVSPFTDESMKIQL